MYRYPLSSHVRRWEIRCVYPCSKPVFHAPHPTVRGRLIMEKHFCTLCEQERSVVFYLPSQKLQRLSCSHDYDQVTGEGRTR